MKLFSVLIASAALAATSVAADILPSPNIGEGITLDTRLDLSGGAIGLGSGGEWTMDHDIDATSHNDMEILLDTCGGLCPDGDPLLGDGNFRAMGSMGSNVTMHSLGSVVGNGVDPSVLQFNHAVNGMYSLGIRDGFTPAAPVTSNQ